MPPTWSRTNIAPIEKNNIIFCLSGDRGVNHTIGQNGSIRIATSSTSPDDTRMIWNVTSASQAPVISVSHAAAGGWQTTKIATIVPVTCKGRPMIKLPDYRQYLVRSEEKCLTDDKTETRIGVLITHQTLSFAIIELEEDQSRPRQLLLHYFTCKTDVSAVEEISLRCLSCPSSMIAHVICMTRIRRARKAAYSMQASTAKERRTTLKW